MELIERILKQNPWWANREPGDIRDYKERFLIGDIAGYFSARQIIAVLGLRRTGKSVLLFQLIKRLLRDVPPRRILYFSFDELMGKDPLIIEKVIEAYENEILRDDLENVYVFFDEISHLDNWQVILKRYYDLRKKIKFFVSGSSSVHIKKSKESLAGRIYEFILPPLSFKEYLYLKGINSADITLNRGILRQELNRYLLCGSLPEIMLETDFQKVKRYIGSLIDKIIFQDIPRVYDVNEPEILKIIMSLIAEKPGMLLEYQTLSSALKVTYQTVSKYVSYLEKAFLIKLVYNFRGSPVARARKLKKAYLGSVTFPPAFLDSEEDVLRIMPLLAENLVCLALGAKWFWKKYTEVDFYHRGSPVEVKYSETKADIGNALLACRYLKSNKLRVVTKDIEKEDKSEGVDISYIPLWRFLLADEVGR